MEFIDLKTYNSYDKLQEYHKLLTADYNWYFVDGNDHLQKISWNLEIPRDRPNWKSELNISEYLDNINSRYSKQVYLNGQEKEAYKYFKKSTEFARENLKGLHKVSLNGVPPQSEVIGDTEKDQHLGKCYTILYSLAIPTEDIVKCGICVGEKKRAFVRQGKMAFNPTYPHYSWYKDIDVSENYDGVGTPIPEWRIVMAHEILLNQFSS